MNYNQPLWRICSICNQYFPTLNYECLTCLTCPACIKAVNKTTAKKKKVQKCIDCGKRTTIGKRCHACVIKDLEKVLTLMPKKKKSKEGKVKMAEQWVERFKVQGTSGKTYTVARNKEGEFGCDCPSWKFQKKVNGKRKDCQHILAKKMELMQKTGLKPSNLPNPKVEEPTTIRSIEFE